MTMNFVIPSERHQKSLEFAINKASASRIFPYIKHIILFGSCARGDFHWSSDVDLLFIMDDDFGNDAELKNDLFTLRGNISPSDSGSPEVDAKFYSETNWNHQNSFFLQNVRKDGIIL